MLYTVMISMTIVIQYINKQGRFCRFRYERIYWFLTSVHGDTKKETQFLKVFANHDMLTPYYAAHLVMFKISFGRDPKKPTTYFNGQNPALASMV